jgi:hypothetical protein
MSKSNEINPDNWEVQFEMAIIRDGQGKKMKLCRIAARQFD